MCVCESTEAARIDYNMTRSTVPLHSASPYHIFMYNKATRSHEISRPQAQKLTPQFVFIYILDIDSHCPYLLSGEPPSI